VAQSLDTQLARFLRSKRGELTYAQFSRQTGLPPSTLFRLENGEQSITLRKLELVLKRLRADISDVFDRH
jgi:transcriptional regulator with XRE-family HTH domain